MSLIYPALQFAVELANAYLCDLLIGGIVVAAIGAAYLSRTTPPRTTR